MKQKIYEKAKRLFRYVMYILLPLVGGGWLGVSCSDFFDQESDHVVYSEEEHLTNWPDTVYSVMGILNKLQAVADRTILLGEVRGDLVQLNTNASADLRELATFTVDDANMYNQPRDYYDIINNCNYYIEHVDTALKSNRNEYIFMKEYVAVKCIRAWTYLQLVLNYGSVPFITKPILTKEESELDYTRYDLAQVCQYFIDDLASVPKEFENQYPGYGDNVRSNHSHHFFFPVNIVRGDLYLWLGSTMGRDAGKPYFEKAALAYYAYISERNNNSYYATGLNFVMWPSGTTSWVSPSGSYNSEFYNESFNAQSELITMIPGDSIPAEGYYSQLRNLFNSSKDNDYMVSILPSNRIQEISEAQTNCVITNNANVATYAPTNLTDHKNGDLRLWSVWAESYMNDDILGRVEMQYLYKYSTRNVHIYRRTMVYMRLAEALNLCGQPLLAYKILERGLNDEVIENEVAPFISKADSIWVANNIRFSTTLYPVLEADHLIGGGTCNTMGIHTRGSGYSPMNEYYNIAYEDSVVYGIAPGVFTEEQTDSVLRALNTKKLKNPYEALYKYYGKQGYEYITFDQAAYEQIKQRQQQQVDSLILNENALEFCFEGTRYYDLMRYALRSDNPGQFLTDHVNQRKGQDNSEGIDLTNRQKWYLRWGNGKIGY